jgi:hypothetical protein
MPDSTPGREPHDRTWGEKKDQNRMKYGTPEHQLIGWGRERGPPHSHWSGLGILHMGSRRGNNLRLAALHATPPTFNAAVMAQNLIPFTYTVNKFKTFISLDPNTKADNELYGLLRVWLLLFRTLMSLTGLVLSVRRMIFSRNTSSRMKISIRKPTVAS